MVAALPAPESTPVPEAAPATPPATPAPAAAPAAAPAPPATGAGPQTRDWLLAAAAAVGMCLLLLAGFAARARLLRDVEAHWTDD